MAARIEVVHLPGLSRSQVGSAQKATEVATTVGSDDFSRLALNDSSMCAVARLVPKEVPTHAVARFILPHCQTSEVSETSEVCVTYRHPVWGKEFRVDGRAPTTGDDTDPEAAWLLRRLRAHWRDEEKFGGAPGNGRWVFRFAAVPMAHLQQAEAKLVHTFREAHGALLCYNKVVPSGAGEE